MIIRAEPAGRRAKPVLFRKTSCGQVQQASRGFAFRRVRDRERFLLHRRCFARLHQPVGITAKRRQQLLPFQPRHQLRP